MYFVNQHLNDWGLIVSKVHQDSKINHCNSWLISFKKNNTGSFHLNMTFLPKFNMIFFKWKSSKLWSIWKIKPLQQLYHNFCSCLMSVCFLSIYIYMFMKVIRLCTFRHSTDFTGAQKIYLQIFSDSILKYLDIQGKRLVSSLQYIFWVT